MNGICYVCGWLAKEVLKKIFLCAMYQQRFGKFQHLSFAFCNCAILTLVKSYVKNPLSYNFNDTFIYLCHFLSTALNFLKPVEIAFRANIINTVNTTDPTVYIKQKILVAFSPPPNCHLDAFVKVVNFYLKLRFFIHEQNCLSKVTGGRDLSSKSAKIQ